MARKYANELNVTGRLKCFVSFLGARVWVVNASVIYSVWERKTLQGTAYARKVWKPELGHSEHLNYKHCVTIFSITQAD